ncbi:MAG: lamin tail domain-containing protein [Dehalococcoidia bacterium]
MYSSDRRVLTVVGLLVLVVVIATAALAVTQRDQAEDVVGAAPRPRLHVERDGNRTCIAVEPMASERCNPQRQALWDNRNGELTASLRARGIPNPTTADILAAYVQMHTEAGDLDVLQNVAQRLGRADLRVVAMGLDPKDPSREYVEIRNIGASAARLSGWTLPAPDGVNAFRFAPAAAFPGVLEPKQSCRVYTHPANQWNVCAGAWDRPPTAALWPADGGWVTLQNAAAAESDRWWYRP